MKNCKQIFTVTLFILTGSLLFAQKNGEEAAVKKVIDQETSSFFEANYSNGLIPGCTILYAT